MDDHHDPRKEIEKLRESLGSHDKPLAFLIGAGASCAAKGLDGDPLIPALEELACRCKEAVTSLGDEHGAAYELIGDELKAKNGRPATVEDVLSSVREKIAAMTDADKLSGVGRTQLVAIEAELRTTIATAANPEKDRFPDELPHRAFGRWLTRIERKVAVEVFTTNYDTLLERGFEEERAPIFDGFVGSRHPFFSPASLLHAEAAPARNWTRLWKIHGSVNWHWEDEGDGGKRIVRGEEGTEGELIFPSVHKYDESRKQPYVAMLEHLRHVLDRDTETLLITSGYSFGDEHINEVIFDALETRDRTHLVALQFEEPGDEHDLTRAAKRLHNVIIYGPETAVVRGKRAGWRLNEAVSERTKYLLDIPFDSDAVPDKDKVSLTGRMRLGDFAVLARFLDSVAGSDE
jgi:SIR2-like domain